MDTTEPAGDFYEADLAFGEQRLGELWEHESYTLRFNLPAGLTFREADALAHRIVVETATRHRGAADWGDLGREFDSSRSTLLSRMPGSTVSGATSLAAIREIQERLRNSQPDINAEGAQGLSASGAFDMVQVVRVSLDGQHPFVGTSGRRRCACGASRARTRRA